MMARFLLELRSTAWRLDSTTPVNIPYMVIRAPPAIVKPAVIISPLHFVMFH